MANHRTCLYHHNNSAMAHKLRLVQSIKAYITNFNFSFRNYMQKDLIEEMKRQKVVKQVENRIYCLGRSVNGFEEFYGLQDSLIWVTYRRDFYLNETMNSDNGWGVSVESCPNGPCQLYFELGLRRSAIISEFLQLGNGAYNINSLILQGKSLWCKGAGSWFSMNEVILMMQSLQQKCIKDKLSNIKIKAYNETINMDQIIKVLSQDQQLVINNNQIPLKDQHQKTGLTTVFLMVTLNFMGGEVTQEQYNALLYLIELRIFRGILGGITDQARFITGKYNNKLIYLDPHYIQPSISPQHLQQNIQSYSCTQSRYMSRQDLDANMAICFQIHNKEDIKALISTIKDIHREMMSKDLDNYFIKYERTMMEGEEWCQSSDESSSNIQVELNEIDFLRRMSSDEIEILM